MNKRQYAREFRIEIAKKTIEGKMTLPEASYAFRVPPATIGSWVENYNKGVYSKPAPVRGPKAKLTPVECSSSMTTDLSEIRRLLTMLCDMCAKHFNTRALPSDNVNGHIGPQFDAEGNVSDH